MNDIELITLRDIFEQAGKSEREIYAIMVMLYYKPEKVREAFYHRACGLTYQKASEKMGTSLHMVRHYVIENCADIHDFIKNPPKFL